MTVDRWRPRATLGVELLLNVIPGLLFGTVLFGIVLDRTGRLAAVASVYGLEGATAGWLVLIAHCFALGGLYAAVLVFLGRADDGLRAALNVDFHDPVAGAIWTGLICLGGWAVVVGLVVPLWLSVVYGKPWTFPAVGWSDPAGAVVFGFVLGGGYPFVRELVAE